MPFVSIRIAREGNGALKVLDRRLAESVITSPVRTSASGPPTAASGETWRTIVPAAVPDIRPSQIDVQADTATVRATLARRITPRVGSPVANEAALRPPSPKWQAAAANLAASLDSGSSSSSPVSSVMSSRSA